MSDKVFNLASSWTSCHDTLTCDHWAWSPVERSKQLFLSQSVDAPVPTCLNHDIYRIYLQKSLMRLMRQNIWYIVSALQSIDSMSKQISYLYVFYMFYTAPDHIYSQHKWTCVHLGCIWLTEVRSLADPAFPQITKSYESEGLIIAMSTTSLPSTPCCGSSAAL